MYNIPVNVIYSMLGIFSFICMLSIGLFKKQKKRCHWLMMLLQTVWSIRLFIYSLLFNPTTSHQAWVWPAYIISSLLYAPAYYLFATDLSNQKGIHRKEMLILLPAAVITIYFIVLFTFFAPDTLQRIHDCAIFNADTLSDSEPMLIMLEYVSYYSIRAFTFWLEAGVMIWCCICLNKYEQTVKEYYSSDEGRSVSQARIISALTVIGVIVLIMLEALPDYQQSMSVRKVLQVFVTLLLQLSLTVLTFSIQYSADGIASMDEPDEAGQPESVKKQDMSISNCWNRLEKLMNVDKVFLEPDLNLIELANRIGTNRTYLSSAVRQYCGKSFSDYVNHARIIYAQQQLLNGATQKDVEFSCGYTSSSTFYRQFQKETGLSPKAWLSIHKSGSNS